MILGRYVHEKLTSGAFACTYLLCTSNGSWRETDFVGIELSSIFSRGGKWLMDNKIDDYLHLFWWGRWYVMLLVFNGLCPRLWCKDARSGRAWREALVGHDVRVWSGMEDEISPRASLGRNDKGDFGRNDKDVFCHSERSEESVLGWWDNMAWCQVWVSMWV